MTLFKRQLARYVRLGVGCYVGVVLVIFKRGYIFNKTFKKKNKNSYDSPLENLLNKKNKYRFMSFQ